MVFKEYLLIGDLNLFYEFMLNVISLFFLIFFFVIF